MGDKMRLGRLTDLRDVDHITRPLGITLVAIPRLDIVGRFKCLGRFGQFTVGLEPNQTLARPASMLQGHALAYRRYSMKYVEHEEAARADGRGIWAGDFVAPWDWWRGERLPAPATPEESLHDEFDALALYDDSGNGRITCKEAREHAIAPVTNWQKSSNHGCLSACKSLHIETLSEHGRCNRSAAFLHPTGTSQSIG